MQSTYVKLRLIGILGAGIAPPLARGSGALALPVLTAAGTGDFAEPGVTGSGAITLAILAGAGEGLFAVPVYEATGDAVLPALTASGAGAHVAPTFAGIGSISLPMPAVAGTGTAAVPTYSGNSTAILPALIAEAVGAFVVPTYSATAALTLPALLATGTATAAPPVYAAAAALSLPVLLANGVGGHAAGYLYDNFTGTDGTNLGSRVPTVRPGSETWTWHAGTLQIQANRLQVTFPSAGFAHATIDLGLTDVEGSLIFNIAVGANTPIVGATARRTQTGENYIRFVYAHALSTLRIQRVIAGEGQTSDATLVIPALTLGQDYLLEWSVHGDSWSMTLDGNVLNYSGVNAGFNNAETRYGVFAQAVQGSGTVVDFDDFNLTISPPLLLSDDFGDVLVDDFGDRLTGL